MFAMQNDGWHWSRIACTSNGVSKIFHLISLLAFVIPHTYGTSILNDTFVPSNSTELQDDTDLLGAILRHNQLETTTKQAQNDIINAVKPRKVTANEWKQLTTSQGPLITQLAFATGAKFNPTVAYITSNSYNKYLDDLGEYLLFIHPLRWSL